MNRTIEICERILELQKAQLKRLQDLQRSGTVQLPHVEAQEIVVLKAELDLINAKKA